MKRFILFPFLVFTLSFHLLSQQLPLFTQYRENATIINPGAMESDFLVNQQNFTIGSSFRSQWTGLEGAPRTRILRGSFVSNGYGGAQLLAGASILSDRTGPTSLTGIYGRIGAVISNDPEYFGISLGLSGGLVQFKYNATEAVLHEDGDVVGESTYAQLFPDIGFGVYAYQTVGDGNTLYGGISVPQLLGLDLKFTEENGEFDIKRIQHFYANIGLIKYFSDGDGFVEPSLWVKYAPNVPINTDFNLRVQLPGSLWIGTGISTAKNFHLDVGFNLGDNVGFDNLIKLGYGYDYSFSDFGPFVGSTHELNLTYSFSN